MPKTRSNTLTWNSRGANDSFLEGKQNKSISKGQQPFAIMMILDFLKDTHQSSYVFPTEKKNNTIIVSPQNGKLFLLPCITVLYCTDVYIIISFTWNICGWCVSTSDLDSSSFLVQHNAGKAHAVQQQYSTSWNSALYSTWGTCSYSNI